MYTRIALVRERAGLNQEAFAQKIGVTKSAISGYETGRRNPTDQTVRSICREFGINEMWLKHGTGEMLAPAADGSLGQLFAEFECTNFEAEFLKAYFALTAAERMEFVKYAIKVFGPVLKNTVGSGVNPFAQYGPDDLDVETEVESYRQELLQQKKAEARSSVSDGSAEKKGNLA